MKLVQLNVWGGRLEKQLEDFFSNEQPDIACLQEAISISGNGAIFAPPEQLQKSWLKSTELFHSPVFTFRFMNRQARFGNGIISSLPLDKKETIFTNLEHKTDFDFDGDDYNIRNLQHAVIDVNGKSLHILNHHGHHVPEHKNGDNHTLRQMKQLGEYIDRLDGPIVLCGDFNLSPTSESLNHINHRLINLSVENHLKTTRNQLTHKTEVCDYIFVNDQIRVESFLASDEIISDHKALILEFDI